MMRVAVTVALAACLISVALASAGVQPPPQPPAQAPPATAGAPKPQAPRTTTPAAASRVSVNVTVTDQSGNGLPEVHVTLTGPVSRDGTTSRDGTLRLQGLRAGTYRLRFQAQDFVTFEREVALKPGAPAEVDVALNRDVSKPSAPPEAPPAPAPTAGRTPAAADPNASVELVALPDWIERNLIGRNDPLKESTVGKTPVNTATVIQVREPLKDRVRNDADEMLYVIAGEGVLRSKGREVSLDAGALVVVPRGVGYSLERRGRNPLIALSVVGK